MRLKVIEIFVICVVAVTAVYVYQNYGNDIRHAFFPEEPTHVIYLGDVAINVTVADDEAERIQGLSGVPSLDDFEGKLFIFDTADRHGIWMKDMRIPIDILWFDDNLKLVHFEEGVTPQTYPNVFGPEDPARFVLEVNANFISSVRVEKGDGLNLPSSLLPPDVKRNLQN